MGLIVPRHRHTAVDRNRLKRRLRELARVHLLPARLPFDVVVRIRPEAYDASFEQLRTDVDHALAQLTRWSQAAVSGDAPPASESGAS